MQEQDKSSYFAIIPADVRYCTVIPDGAKLLFGEITALCNREGYCWASNSYFSSLYNCSTDTVSRWVKLLQDNGFLHVEIDKSKGNQRRIYLSGCIRKNADTLPAKMQIGTRKNADTLSAKMPIAIRKNAEQNSTYNNTEKDIVIESKNQFQNWLLSIKAENSTREAFSLSRKIPIVNFDEYFEAFALEATAKSESYHTRASLLSHFLNFSSSRHYRSTQKYSGGAPGRSAEPARRFATETEIAEPRHRMVVSADSEGIKEPKYRPI